MGTQTHAALHCSDHSLTRDTCQTRKVEVVKMNIFYIKMLWLMLFFSVTESVEIRDGFITEENDFTDKIMSTNVIGVFEHVRSRMECWMICLEDLSCVSMFFNQHSGRCQLNDVLFVSEQDAAQDRGAEYYSLRTGTCPPDYVHVRNLDLCYRLGLAKMRYDPIVAECASRGEHLLAIDSQEKQDHFVKQVTASSESAAASYYLDGSDAVTEGDWRLHDGRKMTFFYWEIGNPTNSTVNKDFIIARKTGGHFRWSDRNAIDAKFYICEQDMGL